MIELMVNDIMFFIRDNTVAAISIGALAVAFLALFTTYTAIKKIR